MNISVELIISIIVYVLTVGVWVGSMNSFKNNINDKISNLKTNVKEDLIRIEQKQDKHNCLIERMVIVEQSTKSAHHRIDDMKAEIKNELENKK